MLSNQKPSSQYIARDASRPEVIIFLLGFDASRLVQIPLKIITASGRDDTCAIYIVN